MLRPSLELDFPCKNPPTGDRLAMLATVSNSVSKLMAEFSGCSFGQGLYRVHRAEDVDYWTTQCVKMFPPYESKVQCFAADWHGRQFAVDLTRKNQSGDDCWCVVFDPNRALDQEINATMEELHGREFKLRPDKLLLSGMYAQWLQNNSAPAVDECVAYEHPIFLGGAEVPENLECCSMESYWELTAEMRSKTRHLPPGVKITRTVTK